MSACSRVALHWPTSTCGSHSWDSMSSTLLAVSRNACYGVWMLGIFVNREKRNVTLLVIAQATLGSQLPMIFTVAGLAGQSLASNICWATLPISLLVFGSMTTAPWLSQIMQRHGRRAGFLLAVAIACVGAAISAYALVKSSFLLFLLGSWLTGSYMSANGFMRFAAADTASEAFRPKAISYVLAGGLVAAIIGPQLVKVTFEATAVPFLGVYLAVIAINIFGSVLFILLDIPKPPTAETKPESARSYKELLTTPKIVVAIICAMVSYALMNLMMTSTPLAVVGCGFGEADAADVVSAHVFAMFLPSFVTGHLIARFGAERIVAAGLLLLTAAGITGLSGVSLANFFGALVLLGFGWNFGYIGATAMLVSAHSPTERGRVQGLNDMLVYGCVTLASLASGTLMNCTGGTATEGWTSVNLAMIPFLVFAAGSLLWLTRRAKPLSAG